MIRRTLRRFCAFLIAILTVCFSLPASASNFTDGLPDIFCSQHVYFANLDADRVLLKKDDGEKIAPASTTKIMTGLVVISHAKDRLDEQVTVTEEMLAGVEGNRMKLEVGATLTIRDLLAATICGGFNDAAHVLCHVIAGSVSEFVSLMNQKAAGLQALDTHYTNPTGIDDPNMFTTLSDTVRVAEEACRNSLYMELSSKVVYDIPQENEQEPLRIFNRNSLISPYYRGGYVNDYAQGLIAGNTDAGHCVVTAPKIKGNLYLCIVMGAIEFDGTIGSYYAANQLIHYAANRFEKKLVLEEDTVICRIPVALAIPNRDGNQPKVEAFIDQDVTIFAPKDAVVGTDIVYKYYLYRETLDAPLEGKIRVGSVDVYYQDEMIGRVPLYVEHKVEASSFLVTLEKLENAILSRLTLLIAIFFCVLCAAYFVLSAYLKRRKRSHSPNRRH